MGGREPPATSHEPRATSHESHATSQTPPPRDRRVSLEIHAPGAVDSHVDADPRAPGEPSRPRRAVSSSMNSVSPQQVHAVLRQRDPHRHRQVARPATESRESAAAAGSRGAVLWRRARAGGASRRCPSSGSSARISTAAGASALPSRRSPGVDAVVQIDVRVTRADRTAARCARVRPGRRVAGRIGFADVGLDFDDDAAGATPRRSWTRTLPSRSRATSSVGRS